MTGRSKGAKCEGSAYGDGCNSRSRVLVVATLIPASSQQGSTIRVYERQGTGFDKYINVDGKRNVTGDYIVGSHPLYRAGTKKRIGRNITNLTLVQPVGR
jgi:hypothetical protein